MNKAIVLAGHGSRHPGAMEALARFTAEVARRYPDFRVELARTMGRNRHVASAEVGGAQLLGTLLDRLLDDGVTAVAVQSLHVVPGEEYHELLAAVARVMGNGRAFEAVSVGGPLLSDLADVDRVAEAVLEVVSTDRAPGEAAVLLGHGAPPPGEGFYAAFGERLAKADPLAFFATLPRQRGAPCPDFGRIRQALATAEVRRARLLPFFTVAGAHACHDLAGQAESSWSSRLAAVGIVCRPMLSGLIETEALARVWLDHLDKAAARI